MKVYLTTTLLLLTLQVMSQTPTNGLIRYYPFSGNANDNTNNSQNGTVFGASLTSDRFGNPNSAYSFDGINDYIEIPLNGLMLDEYTYSAWVMLNNAPTFGNRYAVLTVGSARPGNQSGGDQCIGVLNETTGKKGFAGWGYQTHDAQYYIIEEKDFTLNTWFHMTLIRSNNKLSLYVNCELVGVDSTSNSTQSEYGNVPKSRIGARQDNSYFFNGKIDDVRIYDRALLNYETSMLCNECLNFQTITVTDTLIINSNMIGFNPVEFQNTIKVFPNPTNDFLTVDFGSNYSTMSGYTFQITNMLGQEVYTTPIDQQQTNVDMSTWANGVYYVHLINAQGHIIDTRQIVKQ